MKKKLLTIMCITGSYVAAAQTINIPDPVFEQVLIDSEIDSDGIVNGHILTTDALAVTTLTITSPDISSNITIEDLTGIEGFTNLENLRVIVTLIDELNVNTLTKLKRLECSDNMLTSLDVSNNPLLEYLDITSVGDVMPINNITKIDLSHNPKIKKLIAAGPIDYINLKNGNNNPDMIININKGLIGVPPDVIYGNTCIEVDNATAAQNNQLPYSAWTINHDNKSYSLVASCLAGTEDFKNTMISVYPNPVSDVLNIDTQDGTIIEKAILFDISGRTVREYNTISDSTISVSDLQTGTYILKLTSSKGIFTQKVIKK